MRSGHESIIAYGRINGGSKSQLIKTGNYLDLYTHVLKSYLFDNHGLGSLKSTRKLVKQIESLSPDVISIHNIHGYYLNYKVLFDFIKNSDIPVLWTLHDCWPFTGHCSFFDSVSCMKWQTHCEKCPLTDSYPKSITDRSYNNFEDKLSAFTGVRNLKIITPSKWLAHHVRQSFLKNYPLEVIYNGIDTEVFKPVPVTNTLNKKIVLGVANVWDKRKGLRDFIKISQLLPKDYQIVLIGLTKKQLRGLPENIVGIEKIRKIDDLVAWYNKAFVFVNPTYVDNFPTTNIEALACGTPVVTYNTGGCAEIFNFKSDVLVERGDFNTLLKAILSVDKNDEKTQQSRKYAIKKFNAKNRFNDYLSNYINLKNKNENITH